jgi:hypothetical protein
MQLTGRFPNPAKEIKPYQRKMKKSEHDVLKKQHCAATLRRWFEM